MTTTARVLDVAQILADALAAIVPDDIAEVIAAAGLPTVYADLQATRAALAASDDPIRALAVQVALLADERRRLTRRHAGAVAQARHEHHRAEHLAAQLADRHRLALGAAA